MLTVLVAAGGAGAVRVIDAAADSQMRPVTVYEPGCCRALHADLADEAYALTHRIDSQVPIDEVLAAAEAMGADLVHPGFADPARDAGLARAVEAAGLVWGGAPPALLEELAVHGDAGPARILTAGAADRSRDMRSANTSPETSTQANAAGARADHSVVRQLRPRPAVTRRLSALIARKRGGRCVVLALSDCIAVTDAMPTRPAVVECPAADLAPEITAEITMLAGRVSSTLFTHGLLTLDVELSAAGTVSSLRVVGLRAGLQPEHAAVEEALGVDLAALELQLASGAHDPAMPTETLRHARCRVVRPAASSLRRVIPDRIVELALPSGPGIRCDAGVRPGDLVPGSCEVLFVLTSSGRDRQQLQARADRADIRFVLAGLPVTSTAPPSNSPYGDAPARRPDPAAELLRSGAPQQVVDAALNETAPGVRTLLLEVDKRRVRVAVHPRSRSPRRRPPRQLRSATPPAETPRSR